MTVQSGAVTRVLADGTSIGIEISVMAANFTPTGTLYASASSSAGVIKGPVQVTSNGSGGYTFALDTSNTVTEGRYAGELTIKLCSDQECVTPQAVPSITVPYDITVLAKTTAWPGDKLTPLSPWAGVADWSTFQGNNAHTGYVPVEIKPEQIGLRWKRAPVNGGASNYGNVSSVMPLVTSNGMFYASGSNKIGAYKELDGTRVWSYDVSTMAYPSVNPPAVSGGVVYMAAGQQSSTFMLAFDAATGTIRYKTPMGSQWENYLAPIVLDGSAYTNAGTYGGMYGFGPDGDQLFFASLPQVSQWSPSSNGTSIYAFTGNALTAYNPKNGAVQFKINNNSTDYYGQDVRGAAVVGANGVYAAAYGSASFGGAASNELMRFDTVNGYIDWRVKGAYAVTPAYADGILYAANASPYRVEARNEADGKLQWSWTPPLSGETGFVSPPVVTKNLVFASTNLNTYAIDLRTRKVVWSYPAAGHLAISQNGVLYIQNADALVAVNLK